LRGLGDNEYFALVLGEPRDRATFTGGFVYSWGRGLSVGRSAHATRPLGRLAIDCGGIEITFRWQLPLANKLLRERFGNRIAWSEVDRVQAVRGFLPFPGNAGVKFYGARRLVFSCSPSVRDEILNLAERFAPAGVRVETDPKCIVPG
jgi:hypothetical protein